MNMDEIYRMYFQDVYRYIRAISQNETLAEDVTQETFFKAMKKIDKFRGDCSLKTWLCQIAKRTMLDHLRKGKREEALPEEADEVTAAESAAGSMEEKLADHTEALRIHACLHRLREPYKEVFSLRTFGELSYAEIGNLFGKSENWARVTYHRARVKIREELDHENNLPSH